MTPDEDAQTLSTLSPQEAEAILAADLRNILLKVKEQRTLTDKEREIIRQRTVAKEDDPADPAPPAPAAHPRWAKTIVDLAEILKVDRRTLGNWRQRPGCPDARSNGQYFVADWIAFGRSIGSPGIDAALPHNPADEKRQWETRNLQAQAEERELKLAIKRGEYTHNSQIAAEISARVQEAVSVLRAKFERELPQLYTAEPEADRALNKAAIDEVCERLSRPLPCVEETALNVADIEEDADDE